MKSLTESEESLPLLTTAQFVETLADAGAPHRIRYHEGLLCVRGPGKGGPWRYVGTFANTDLGHALVEDYFGAPAQEEPGRQGRPVMPSRTPLGHRIDEVLRRSGWTLQQLSAASGISTRTLHRLRRSQRGARWQTVHTLATFLGSAAEPLLAPPRKK